MIISNFINNYTLSSYNIQQKVDIIHSIRIETSCAKSLALLTILHNVPRAKPLLCSVARKARDFA